MNPNEAAFDCSEFRYLPECGSIIRVSDLKRVGTNAGSTCRYRRVSKNRVRVLEHRLAWRLMTGRWPAGEIDHRNGITDDNRWCNLREATAFENRQNIRDRSTHRGAYWDRVNNRYVVSVQSNGRRIQSGASSYFSAVVASRLIRRVLHGEFAYESRIQ